MNYVAFLLCCIKPSSCLAWILCGVYAEIVYLGGGDLAPSLGDGKSFSRTKISELRFFGTNSHFHAQNF